MSDQQNSSNTGRKQMSNGGSALVGMATAAGLSFVLFIAPGPLSHHHQSTAPTTNSARQQ